VRAEAGELIDKWVVEHGEAYRNELPPDRCSHARPVLGFQQVCPACHGRKELTCNGCGGRGRVTCGSCGGRGRVTCSSCGGSRQTRCFSCGGSGTHEVREMEVSYSDRQNTMNQQMQMTRRVPCPGCGGSGNKPCGCDGTQACGCAGGQVTCGGCGGRGIVLCDTCAATGVVNYTGRVQCSVDRRVGVTVGGSATAEDRQTLSERVPFERIGALAAETGGVRLEQRNRAEHVLMLAYAASVPLESAECTLRGKVVSIRAYGAGHDIYNYQELVGTLLEPDLAALEKSLSEHSVFRATSRASLASVTNRFLASELNALIAQAAPRPVAAPPASAPRGLSVARVIGQALMLAPVARLFRRSGLVLKIVLVAVGLGMLVRPMDWYPILAFVCLFVEWRYQRNPPPAGAGEVESDASTRARAEATAALQKTVGAGMVSPKYVERAGAAIDKAVPRLYGPLIVPMVGWLIAGVAAVSVLTSQVWRWTPGEALLASVALSAIAWFLIERRAESSLKTLLGDSLYQRLKRRLGETRSRYRLLGAAGFVIGLFVGEVVVRFIAHVRYGVPFPW